MTRKTGTPAIAYRRVSTERQSAEGWSLAAQRDRMAEYATEHGLRFVDEIEEAESASEEGRPGFKRLIKSLRSGRAAIVVAEKLDRLSRNLRDLADIEDVVRAGVAVHLVRDRQILDRDSPPGVWLTHHIGGAVAIHHTNNLRLEVKKGMRARAASGKFANGIPPFGYRLSERGGDLVIDEDEAPIVVAIFRRYAHGGRSLADVAAWADSKGYKTRKGRAWGTVTVQGLLRNRTYTGQAVRFHGEWFEADHPAIVSPSLWASVRAVEAQRASGRSSPKGYAHKRRSDDRRPYSGLLSCEACAGPVCYSPKRHKDGRLRYRYWLCRNPACEHHRYVREERIAEAVEAMMGGLKIPKSMAKAAVKSAAKAPGLDPETLAEAAAAVARVALRILSREAGERTEPQADV